MVSMLLGGLLKSMKTRRNINLFLLAQGVSLFGSALVQYALIWQITLLTSSGKALTISTLCGFLPQFLISFLAGVWADRYQRKWLIMLSDGLIALATLFLIFTNSDALLINIYFVLAIRSIGTGIQQPASQSGIAELTDQDDLARANGWMSTMQSAISFVAPAFSGFLLSQISFKAILWIDIVTALVGIILTSTIPFGKPNSHHQNTSLWLELRSGFTYVFQTTWLKSLLVYQCLLMFLISPTAFMTPLCVSRVFGPEVWRLSVAEMTYSLGMVIGGILISKNTKYGQLISTTFRAGMFYGLCMVGMGTFKVAVLFYLANTLIGISSPCYQVPLYTHLQSHINTDKLGRVFSILGMCNSLAMPLGMVLFGPLADMMDVRGVFAGCGCIVMLLSLYMLSRKKVIFQ